MPWLHNKAVYLIPCGLTKLSSRAPAGKLYRSPRFRQQLKFVKALSATALIFSSKFGLLEPDAVIDPYDLSLSDLKETEIDHLRRICVEKLIEVIRKTECEELVVLSAGDGHNSCLYNNFIKDVARLASGSVVFLSPGGTDTIVGEGPAILARRRYLEDFYGQRGAFKDLIGPISFFRFPHQQLPNNGVYFFTDWQEPSAISGSTGRIVRVGTHGVASGSKATLAQRLRAHFGLSSGAGNHRSSIFRLHVGECLVSSGLYHKEVSSWQRKLPSDTAGRDLETSLEMAVSEYIRQLNLWILEVNGPSHKRSRRSLVEAKVIRNLTASGIILDRPSPKWIGRFSTRPQIVNSGLWNVQHVGDPPGPPSNQMKFAFA